MVLEPIQAEGIMQEMVLKTIKMQVVKEMTLQVQESTKEESLAISQ